MADTTRVQVRFRIKDFEDSLYYPLADWPVDPAVLDATKTARYDAWVAAVEAAKLQVQPEPDATLRVTCEDGAVVEV